MNTQNTKSREQLLQEVAHLQRRVAELEASVEPLQASEARIRAVLANNAIVVFDHDQELRYTRIYNPNPNFTVEGVVGKMDADLFLPDDAARLTGIKRRVLATGMGERQAIQTTLGGETFYYDLTVESRLDEAGQVVGLTCAAMDITERKQTEKALRENEERLALIIKGAELGTWDWHIPGGELVVNERWAEMLGYTLAEVEPHINTWEKLIHPADAERVLQNTQAHVNGQIPLFQEEYRVSAKSGESL